MVLANIRAHVVFPTPRLLGYLFLEEREERLEELLDASFKIISASLAK